MRKNTCGNPAVSYILPKRKKRGFPGQRERRFCASDVEFSPSCGKPMWKTGCPGINEQVFQTGFPQAVEKNPVEKGDILWLSGIFWGFGRICTPRTRVFNSFPHPCLKVLGLGNSFPQRCGKSPLSPSRARLHKKNRADVRQPLDKPGMLWYTLCACEFRRGH